ncbi:hypothetical protein PbJCM13498_33660 [Prolixibacter bellariivorans]|uniref:Outer membrane protein beta-barrel domain-containing protein n=1 Tax=Prolixibacter bellariivorans TaxID=314319 RepID=A0A5M4B3X3_9BACT|nr:outer membrane beta-barrel protein [Prolixibacter bellariivorans]GET34503.1 hypothetical protein PbJCM13498_33660 [Prolixibacter bellariivorans]
MKTKSVSLVLLFLLSTSLVFAQGNDQPKTSIAILGGINFQNLNGDDMSGNKLKNDMIIGFHGGINIQIPVASEFYFQPGLMLSTKGAKNKDGLITSTYKLSYIELPLNFVYKVWLGNGYFMLGFGPFMAYGVGGKATFEGGAVTVSSDIEFKSTVDAGDPLTVAYFKPFDAGANLFFGYELASGIFIQLNTQLGLVKINPEDNRVSDDQSSVKNTGYGISLGYRF